MTPAAYATLESLLGPIEQGDKFGQLEDLEARMNRRSDVAELVALEVLLARQAEMIQLASQVASDDVRTNHTENMKRIGPLIDDLVRTIRNDTDISLDAEGEKLVSRAEGGPSDTAGSITVTVDNRRRG